MSIRKAREFYKSLTPKQQHFVDKKTMSDTLKVKQWFQFLSRAADYDEYTDTLEKKYRVRSYWMMGISIFSLVFGFIILGANDAMEQFPFLLLWITILISLYFFWRSRAKQMKAHDLHDTLRLMFVPLLKLLMVKAGPGARLSANLDFRDPTDNEPDKYKDARARNVKHYKHTYIMCKTVLQDGGLLELVSGDDIRKLSYWKTSASGKSKHKSKTKTTHIIFVKLSVPTAHYTVKEDRPNPEIDVTIDDDRIILKYRFKMKFQEPHILKSHSAQKLLHKVYDQLEPIPGAVTAPQRLRDREDDVEDDDVPDILPVMIWQEDYFDDYDVYGTSYGYYDYDYDDDDHVNVFDS